MNDSRSIRTAVLICTHNGAAHVVQQLESIAAQTLSLDEWHIVDWASTDHTLDQVGQWLASKEPSYAQRVRIVRRDTAPGAAQSFLFSLAELASASNADLIFLCDQDDLWHKDKVERVVQAYENNRFDIAFSDAVVSNESLGTRFESFYGKGGPYRAPSTTLDRAVLLTDFVIGMTMCVRREWLQRVKSAFSLYWIMHDWALVILCWATNGRIQYLPEPLAIYRQHEGNLMGAAVGRSAFRKLLSVRSHIAGVRRQLQSAALANSLIGADRSVAATVNLMHSRRVQIAAALSASPLNARYRIFLAAALTVF